MKACQLGRIAFLHFCTLSISVRKFYILRPTKHLVHHYMELNNSTHEDRESAIRRAANTAWREMKKDPDSFQFNTLDKALDKTVNDFFADKETLDRVCSAMTSMWPIGRHYRPMVIVKALKNQYKFEIFDVTRVNKICVPEKLDMPYYELTPYKDLGRALVAFADWVECLNEVGWVAPRKGQTAGTTRRHHPKYLETLREFILCSSCDQILTVE
jgi:hypothetical protein